MKSKYRFILLIITMVMIFSILQVSVEAAGITVTDPNEAAVPDARDYKQIYLASNGINLNATITYYMAPTIDEFFFYVDTDGIAGADVCIRCHATDFKVYQPSAPGYYNVLVYTGVPSLNGINYSLSIPWSTCFGTVNSVNVWVYDMTGMDRLPDSGSISIGLPAGTTVMDPNEAAVPDVRDFKQIYLTSDGMNLNATITYYTAPTIDEFFFYVDTDGIAGADVCIRCHATDFKVYQPSAPGYYNILVYTGVPSLSGTNYSLSIPWITCFGMVTPVNIWLYDMTGMDRLPDSGSISIGLPGVPPGTTVSDPNEASIPDALDYKQIFLGSDGTNLNATITYYLPPTINEFFFYVDTDGVTGADVCIRCHGTDFKVYKPSAPGYYNILIYTGVPRLNGINYSLSIPWSACFGTASPVRVWLYDMNSTDLMPDSGNVSVNK